MLRRTRLTVVVLAVASAVTHNQAAVLTEDFSSDPLATWSFGVGDNSNSQFTWNSGALPAYTGDSAGELQVHLNSSLPTARLDRPLGATLGQNTSFTVSTRFSFSVTSAPGEQGMQMAFGLVNSGLTGGDRTGSFANFSSDNTFHTVEFNYFPNVSPFFGGPTLAPTVFGAQKGSSDAFGNFASLFGSASDLGGNTVGITALPQNVTLQANLDYDAAVRLVTLTMYQVNGDGSLSLLNTELPTLDLNAPGGFSTYDTAFPFVVDSLAIMAYRDGFTTSSDPSLVADLAFQSFTVTGGLVPEPSVGLLLLTGWLVLSPSLSRRFRHESRCPLTRQGVQ